MIARVSRLLLAFMRADNRLEWLADKAAWRGFWQRIPIEEEANRAFDRRHGTDTADEIGLVETGVSGEQARAGNGVYRPLWEGAFHDALRTVGVAFDDYSFVDLGCGKGKLLMLASAYPFARIVGVEYSPGLLAIAQRNLTVFRTAEQKCHQLEAVLGDARHWRLPPGPVLVLIFNSFDPATTREVMRGIDAEAKRDEPLFVLYVNVRRVAEAGDGFAGLGALERVQANRRLLVFANAAGRAARKGRGPFTR
jgi:SAM-dependent methyltransferase